MELEKFNLDILDNISDVVDTIIVCAPEIKADDLERLPLDAYQLIEPIYQEEIKKYIMGEIDKNKAKNFPNGSFDIAIKDIADIACKNIGERLRENELLLCMWWTIMFLEVWKHSKTEEDFIIKLKNLSKEVIKKA